MDRGNPIFRPIHGACHSVYHSLHSGGIGVSVRHASIVSDNEERKLWEHGILGVDNSKSLQQAAFYFIGKRFCIRGGEEQRNLGPSNFVRSYNPDCFTYVEHGSKNYNARAKDLRYENKEVPCPALPENRPKCLVYILNLYMAKLPMFAFQNDILYLRPKRTTPSAPGEPWYDNIAVEKNSLRTMVKDMFAKVDIAGKNNHSLRATGATTLFQNDVPERVIQKVTGHRSLEALRTYERISTEQHKNVSEVVMNNVQQNSIKTTAIVAGPDCLFGGINGCTIGNITVNFSSKMVPTKPEETP